ncbi:MAG: OprO/OprP family phosphate-selective porin [Tannerellaceae bacterium]|nr:OprO/OprP family phosphate-selective porin [Tannerellaceae bacterium]
MMTLIVVPSFAQSNDNNDLEKRTQALEKAVKTLSKVKVSGYIQTQFQSGQENASLKVGSGKASTEDSFNRIGVRRGRVKFTFEEGITSAVFQLDFTDKGGVKFKDAYLNVKDPWFRTSALRAGIFDRPFGYEIGYSSSRRESPERSAIFQMLFPDERDLGAMLILQPSKESSLHALKFQGGLFAGNGIKADVDNRKDFIGQLRIDNNLG